MPDRIEETLRALQLDVERTPLADSGSVRRKGDRRTRNQVLASAFVTVGLVAGVIGVGGSLVGGDNRGIEGPPATDGPTVTTTPEPEPALAEQPLLPADGLVGFGAYDEIGTFVDSGEEPKILAKQCAVRPGGWEASQVLSTGYHQDGTEAGVREYVLLFDDAASAEQAALKRAYADLVASCPGSVDPSEGTLSTRDSEIVPGLDGAVRSSRYFVPAYASEPNYYEVATAHRGPVVVVLEWQASANPIGEGAADWVWDAERLQAALDRAVG
jgi:hypothetical protein